MDVVRRHICIINDNNNWCRLVVSFSVSFFLPVFTISIDPKVGGPQTANLQVCGFFYRFADIPQVWHFVDFRFANHIFFAICGFSICGLKTFAYT
jgi:hypothetical protein